MPLSTGRVLFSKDYFLSPPPPPTPAQHLFFFPGSRRFCFLFKSLRIFHTVPVLVLCCSNNRTVKLIDRMFRNKFPFIEQQCIMFALL